MGTTYYDKYSNPIEDWTSPSGGTALAGFEGGGAGYAGLGYDNDQWNARMDKESAMFDTLRAQQDLQRSNTRYGLGGGTGTRQPSTGSRSYETPAQYAASQPMALQIDSLPKLSLTTPQYKPWNSAEEQSEVYKAASPMIRENRRRMDALRASLSGLDPTMRRLQQKDIMQGYGDSLSKTFGTANQIGGQRYINKLNYDNQQAAQNAQIANQQAIADHTQKMSAIDYNLKLGQQGQRLPKYQYTDYL